MALETTTAEPTIEGQTVKTEEGNIGDKSPVVQTADPPAPAIEPVVAVTPEPEIKPNTTPQWLQKRVDKVIAEREAAERIAQEADDRAKAAETKLAQVLETQAKGGAATPPAAVTPSLGEQEIETRALAKAQAIAYANQFNKSCDTIASDGAKEFKDWSEATKNLTMVGAIGKNANIAFLETAIDLKDPHKILYHLGMNPQEAERIASLPPKKMALEMARVEAKLDKPPEPKPVSGAPAPVIPIAGAGKVTPSLDDPQLSSEEWMTMRAQQVDARRNRYKR